MDYCQILRDAKTIAVVGISSDSENTSRNIARYLVSFGYNVVGVNPNIREEFVESIRIFKNLIDVPDQIDIVDVFRKSKDVAEMIEDVLLVKPKVLWLQLGIINDEAIETVNKAGIIGIQNRCIFVEHKKCSNQ